MATSRLKSRKVCLFGTSANPPTGSNGHAGIVKALSSLKADDEKTPAFDEIRVLPVYKHMFSVSSFCLSSLFDELSVLEYVLNIK